MIKLKHIIVIYISLIILITIISAKIIVKKNKEINKLKEINKELKEINIEYKWQLNEIPLIIESNKEAICKE